MISKSIGAREYFPLNQGGEGAKITRVRYKVFCYRGEVDKDMVSLRFYGGKYAADKMLRSITNADCSNLLLTPLQIILYFFFRGENITKQFQIKTVFKLKGLSSL